MGRLRSRYRSTSVNDLFALVLAQHLGVILLTSDRHLREAAAKEQVAVHGTLWVLDEMVRLALISPIRAADALDIMLTNSRRLPLAACESRLKQWRKG